MVPLTLGSVLVLEGKLKEALWRQYNNLLPSVKLHAFMLVCEFLKFVLGRAPLMNFTDKRILGSFLLLDF